MKHKKRIKIQRKSLIANTELLNTNISNIILLDFSCDNVFG